MSNYDSTHPEVFISYSSQDRDAVIKICEHLEKGGVTVWRDETNILGGDIFGREIVTAIKNCKVIIVMCSSSALDSINVQQEILLAWKYRKSYLPLLIEDLVSTGFPEQVQYFLEGRQWIPIFDREASEWVPKVNRTLEKRGVSFGGSSSESDEMNHKFDLDKLFSMASLTKDIWPQLAMGERGMGANPTRRTHGIPIGSRVLLTIESRQEGYLTLINKGNEGTLYCLCPSLFAQNSKINDGQLILPQPDSPHDAFVISGAPGREELLAIISQEPIDLDWQSNDPEAPAKVLTDQDIKDLLQKLNSLDGWNALSTFFDVTA